LNIKYLQISDLNPATICNVQCAPKISLWRCVQFMVPSSAPFYCCHPISERPHKNIRTCVNKVPQASSAPVVNSDKLPTFNSRFVNENVLNFLIFWFRSTSCPSFLHHIQLISINYQFRRDMTNIPNSWFEEIATKRSLV